MEDSLENPKCSHDDEKNTVMPEGAPPLLAESSDETDDELHFDPGRKRFKIRERRTRHNDDMHERVATSHGSLVEYLLLRRRRRRGQLAGKAILVPSHKGGMTVPDISPSITNTLSMSASDMMTNTSLMTMSTQSECLDAGELAQLFVSCTALRVFQQLDWTIGLAVGIMAFGATCQLWVLLTWYLWYFRIILACGLLVASWVYLHPKCTETINGVVHRRDQAMLAMLVESDVTTAWYIQRAVVLVLLLPACLEMKAISFLASVVIRGGTDAILSTLTIQSLVISVQCWKEASGARQAGKAQAQNEAIGQKTKISRNGPARGAHQYTFACYGILYMAALVTALWQHDVWSIPYLAGPFLLATGALLMVHRLQQLQLATLLQLALRQTLLDVLMTARTRVQKDGMLLLAFLRWIADYWDTDATLGRSILASLPPLKIVSHEPCAADQNSSTASSVPEIAWGDLSTMLNVSAEQMQGEMQMIVYDSLYHHEEATSRAKRHADLRNLKYMLSNMNLDKDAKPVVLGYKRLISSLPPSTRTACLVSVLRRMPATLFVVFYALFHPILISCSFLCLLLPIIALEYLRLQTWWRAVSRSGDASERWTMAQQIKSIDHQDPMCVLFASDNGTTSLLRVWKNLQASVAALEWGLTAARCAQTSMVAVDFAKHLRSLVKVSWKVVKESQRHGLSGALVLLEEGDTKARIKNDAKAILRDGRVIRRNVKVLVQEQHLLARPQRRWRRAFSRHKHATRHDDEVAAVPVLVIESEAAAEAREERADEIMSLLAQCETICAVDVGLKNEISQALAANDMTLDDPWFVATSTQLRHILEVAGVYSSLAAEDSVAPAVANLNAASAAPTSVAVSKEELKSSATEQVRVAVHA